MPRIEGLARGERVTRRMCRVCSTSAALVMTTMQICMPVSGGVPAIPRSDTRLICEDLAVLRKLPRSSRADDIAFLFDKFEGTLSYSLRLRLQPTHADSSGVLLHRYLARRH